MKKILVLGSNSFTGSHFINYILEKTDAKVIGISRSDEYDPIFLPYLYKKERPKNFNFYKLDVNKNLEDIVELIENEKPEVIVNYSAQGEVRNSWNFPEQWFQTNCMSVVKLGNSLKDKKYLKKYVHISTPEIYGITENNAKENSNFNPSTPYGASKLAGELFLNTLFKRFNFPLVSTRSVNVFGKHQQLYRIIPRTIICLKLGKKIELHGKGKTIRSFIHAKDIADATLKVIQSDKVGEVYHLSTNEEGISLYSLVQKICFKMNYDFEESTLLIEENFGQDAIYSLDSSKARKELNWRPKISLDEGIEETIEWVEENWDKIKTKELNYIHKE